MKTSARSKQTTARKTGDRSEEGREPERRASSSPGVSDLLSLAFAPPEHEEGKPRRFPVVADARLVEAAAMVEAAAAYVGDKALTGRSRGWLAAYGLRLVVLDLLRRVRLRCPAPPGEYRKGRELFESGDGLPASAPALLRLGFEDALHALKEPERP